MQIILTIITLLLLSSCAVPPDDWQNTRPGSDDQWMASMDVSLEPVSYTHLTLPTKA